MAVGQNAVGTDLYQWDNVPKAVVEGLEGSLNVPVSETVMWTNNITYMLKSENKTTGDRLSIIPEYTLNSTLSWQAREDLSMQTTFTWYGKQQPKKYNYKGQPGWPGNQRNQSLQHCGSERDLGCDEECQSDRRRGQPVRQTFVACG